MRNCFHGSEQPMNSRTQNEPGVRLHGSFPGWASDFTDHALRLMVKKALPEAIPAVPLSAGFHLSRPFRIVNFYRYNSLLFSFVTNGDFRI